MFGSIQIKQEYNMEDRAHQNVVAGNTTIEYPVFNAANIEYPYHQLPHFWNQNHPQIQYVKDFSQKNEALSRQEMPRTPTTTTSPTYVNQQHPLTYTNEHSSENQSQINQCTIGTGQNETRMSTSVISDSAMLNSPSIPAVQSTSTSTTTEQRTETGRPSKGSGSTKKVKCQCEICFKEFGHKSNLFIHMRTHNGERPYKCKECEKCFTHSGNLAIHMRTHSGERPYACQVCGKMFSHSGNLSTHLRTHSGVKPYKCKICSKDFRHSGNLSIHERIHSGIKPFQCKVCGKEFYHSGNLTTHMKKHPVTINTEQCEARVIPILTPEYVCSTINQATINQANINQPKEESKEQVVEVAESLVEAELNEESNPS